MVNGRSQPMDLGALKFWDTWKLLPFLQQTNPSYWDQFWVVCPAVWYESTLSTTVIDPKKGDSSEGLLRWETEYWIKLFKLWVKSLDPRWLQTPSCRISLKIISDVYRFFHFNLTPSFKIVLLYVGWVFGTLPKLQTWAPEDCWIVRDEIEKDIPTVWRSPLPPYYKWTHKLLHWLIWLASSTWCLLSRSQDTSIYNQIFEHETTLRLFNFFPSRIWKETSMSCMTAFAMFLAPWFGEPWRFQAKLPLQRSGWPNAGLGESGDRSPCWTWPPCNPRQLGTDNTHQTDGDTNWTQEKGVSMCFVFFNCFFWLVLLTGNVAGVVVFCRIFFRRGNSDMICGDVWAGVVGRWESAEVPHYQHLPASALQKTSIKDEDETDTHQFETYLEIHRAWKK